MVIQFGIPIKHKLFKLTLMKKTLLFIGLMASFNLFAQQILHEPFNYTIGETLTGKTLTGVGTWVDRGSSSNDDVKIVAQPTWGSFGIPAATGNAANYYGGGDDLKLPFPEVNSGTIYYSFLINIVAFNNPATLDVYRQINLLNGTGNAGPALFLRKGATDDTFKIGYGSTDTTSKAIFTTTDYAVGSQFFIVISFKIDGSTDSIGKLWINPTVSTTEPASDLSLTGTDKDRNEFSAISMEQSSNSRTPDTIIDEIRVGTTWDSVTTNPSTASVVDNQIPGLSIYPNPSNSFIKISASEKITGVEIYNVIGKKVISISNFNDNKVDISSLSKGVYFLKVTDGDSVATKKIIKN